MFSILIPLHYVIYRKKEKVLEDGKFWTVYDGLKKSRFYTAMQFSTLLFRRMFLMFMVLVARNAHWAAKMVPIIVL
jgi:hypothetical protein